MLNEIPKTHLGDNFCTKHNERLPMSKARGLCELSLHYFYYSKSLNRDILVIDQCRYELDTCPFYLLIRIFQAL